MPVRRIVARTLALRLGAAAMLPPVAACASSIDSSVQSFAAPDTLHPEDRVFVAPSVPPGAQPTLEMRTWVGMAQAEFQQRGIAVAPTVRDATAIAIIDLSRDKGQTVTSNYAIPQFGVTGYSGATTTGTVTGFGNTATYSSNTTLRPTYGVTGYATGTRTSTSYTRTGELLIGRPNPSGPPTVVFESRLQSVGSCGMLAAVSPTLVKALFATFPNGGVQRVKSEWNGRC